MTEKAKTRRPRRANGEGGGTLRPDGLWQWRVTLPAGQRIAATAKTQAEAKQRFLAKASLIEQGIAPQANRQTLATFLSWWLEDVVAAKNQPKTAATYRDVLRLHVIPDLGAIELGKLTAQHVQSLLRRKSKAGLSPRSVAMIRSVLRTALNAAIKVGAVERNAATLAEPPRQERTERHPLTPEQTRALLSAVDGDRLAALYRVAVTLGLRQGELLGPRWDDVDLDAASLRVRQALQRIDGSLVLKAPKTERSRRTPALPASGVAALRSHRIRQLEERLAAGGRWHDGGLLFASTIGTPLEPRNVLRAFKGHLEAAGLPDQRFHDLRHTSASTLLSHGVSVKAVADWLGWRRPPSR